MIDRQFGWSRGLTAADLAGDSTHVARLMASYDDDPTYATPVVQVRDMVVEGVVESTALRIYEPVQQAGDRRVVVWSHGGGFAGGAIDDREADGVSRELVARTGATLVSVDYRLARPDRQYPKLHQEVLAAYRWVIGDGLGAEPSDVTIGGASAGASLSLAAALEQRDSGGAVPGGLLLAYPLLYRRSPGIELPADAHLVPEVLRIRQQAVDFLIGMYEGPVRAPPTYAVADGHELTGLPRSLVICAEYDDLRGHGEQYLQLAHEFGVPCEVYKAAGIPHGHLQFSPRVPETERTLAVMADFITAN